MPSRPFIYCCVPREGIMTFCFWYGLTNLSLLAIVGALALLNQETFDWLMSILNPDDIQDTLLDYIELAAQSAIGIAYMYGSYLAYKRNFKPFNTLLYFFAADLAWTLCNVCKEVKDGYYLTRGEELAPMDEVIPTTNLTQLETKSGSSSDGKTPLGIILFTLIFLVFIPFLNKLYVIMKIRAYVKYVEYKKDEAKLSSTILEAPQKHPEIIKE